LEHIIGVKIKKLGKRRVGGGGGRKGGREGGDIENERIHCSLNVWSGGFLKVHEFGHFG